MILDKSIFISDLSKCGVNCSENSILDMESFYNSVIEYNKHTNLTAITDKFEFYYKHYWDSLYLIPYIKDNSTVIDIGAGAGFPSIPLKIVNNTLKITMLDALNKRIVFLSQIIELFNMHSTIAMHNRAEILAQNELYREKFDYTVSRAVANLNLLCELSLPYIKIGGTMLALKGSDVKEELINSKKCIELLGGKVEKVINYNLPYNLGERNLIIIKKIKRTPNKYPRNMSVIKNKPL